MSNKAAVLPEKKASTQIQEVEKYKPGKGEVLVRNHFVATNPVDWKIQKYGAFFEKYPGILGTDSAGVIEEVGEGVTSFKKGDKVWTMTPLLMTFDYKYGTFQEYSVSLESTTLPLPSNVSLETAAGLGLAPATAAFALFVALKIPRPTSVTRPTISPDAPILFVSGGATAVGSTAVQLGALAGLRVVATASPKNFEHVKSLGAYEVLDYKDNDLVNKVKSIAGGKPIQYAFDSVAEGGTIERTAEILGQGLLPTVLPPSKDFKSESVTVKYIFFGDIIKPENADVQKWWFPFLNSAIEAGSIVPTKPAVVAHGLEEAQKILDFHASGQVSAAKPVLQVVV